MSFWSTVAYGSCETFSTIAPARMYPELLYFQFVPGLKSSGLFTNRLMISCVVVGFGSFGKKSAISEMSGMPDVWLRIWRIVIGRHAFGQALTYFGTR